MSNFSFLKNDQLKANCIKPLIEYAYWNSDRMINVKLDENLVEDIEKKYGSLFKVCPSNLNVISA